MTAQVAPQPARTYARHTPAWVGDDVDLTARSDLGGTNYPADVFIRDAAGDDVATLHLSPTAARKLRDSLTLVLVELEVAEITAAGLAAPVARSFGEAAVVSDYPADLAIVRSFSTPGVTS